MESHTEAQAIAQLKNGDKKGLAFLVRQHQVRAIRAAYLITQNLHDAEEIVQDAFIRVYERIEQFDSSRPFAPWFLRIVVNDATKLVSRRPWVDPLPDDLPHQSTGKGRHQTADPAAIFETEEYKQMVRDALKGLAPQHREVIVLRYFLDFSEREIALEMGIPPGTVKSRLSNAKQHLRRLLIHAQTTDHHVIHPEQQEDRR